MPNDPNRYTREHLGEVILRLRGNHTEFDRIKSSLSTEHARTLKKDVLGGWEKRVAGRRIDTEYMHAVCLLNLNRFSSEVYNSVINTIVDDTESQKRLDSMIGKYRAYWPSGEDGNFATFDLEIGCKDGVYWVSTTTRDADHEYKHFGHAFLIRNRVHVIAVRKMGIRTIVFHYEDVPARHPPRGIIMNVLRKSEDAHNGEELFAVHFLAIHQNDRRYKLGITNDQIATILHHDRNRTGVIRV